MSDRYERDPEDFADWPEQDEPDPEDYFEYMPQEQQQGNERYQMQPDQGNPWDDPEYVDKVNRQSCFSLNATLEGLKEWMGFYANRIGCSLRVVPGDIEECVTIHVESFMGAFDDYEGFDLEITAMPESGTCGIDGYCPDSRDYFHYKEFIKATFERFQGLWIREPIWQEPAQAKVSEEEQPTLRKDNTVPRVPTRLYYKRRWSAIWELIRDQVGSKSYVDLESYLLEVNKDLACSADVIADIIRAGEAGLLNNL